MVLCGPSSVGASYPNSIFCPECFCSGFEYVDWALCLEDFSLVFGVVFRGEYLVYKNWAHLNLLFAIWSVSIRPLSNYDCVVFQELHSYFDSEVTFRGLLLESHISERAVDLQVDSLLERAVGHQDFDDVVTFGRRCMYVFKVW